VDEPGKKRITYAAHGNDLVTTVAGNVLPAVVGSVGGIIAADRIKCSSNCGDTLMLSNAVANSLAKSKVKVKID